MVMKYGRRFEGREEEYVRVGGSRGGRVRR
jgi:hypothetical protein